MQEEAEKSPGVCNNSKNNVIHYVKARFLFLVLSQMKW